MPEPPLNRRQRHAGIHPPRARFAPQIVEVQPVDLRALTRQPPRGLDRPPTPPHFVTEHERRPAGGAPPPDRSYGASSTARSTVEIGTRRGFFAFVFPAGRNSSPRT